MFHEPEQQLTADMTLLEVIRLMPQSVSVFEELGIDYACGGATALKSAAGSVGMTARELLTTLRMRPRVASRDWYAAPISELTQYLLHDHHRLEELARAVGNAIKTALEVHGPITHLRRMQELEIGLCETMSMHTRSEERELFPAVEALEAAAANPVPGAPPLRISARVLREMIEHEEFRNRVHALHDLLGELLLEYDLHALRAALKAFEQHLLSHMHLENNVLYPRAIEIENSLRHGASQ